MQEANKFAQKAEAVMRKFNPHLQFYKLDEMMVLLYRSAMIAKKLSRWKEAADFELQCAVYLKNNHKPAEAAACFTDAALDYLKVDKTAALNALADALALYCDLGRFDIAAALERRVADIHFRYKHFEEAAMHFRKAANFLFGEFRYDQSAYCMERSALCCLEIKDYDRASKIYFKLAEDSVLSNLRFFNAKDYILRALLSLMGIPIVLRRPVTPSEGVKKKKRSKKSKSKSAESEDEGVSRPDSANSNPEADNDPVKIKYGNIGQKMIDMCDIDCTWKCSKEALFIKNIIKYRLELNMDAFADHIYYWNNVRLLDQYQAVMLAVVRDEITLELEILEEKRLQEFREIERERIRKEKYIEQKKIMKKMRIRGEVKVDEAEVEKALAELEAELKAKELAKVPKGLADDLASQSLKVNDIESAVKKVGEVSTKS